MSDATRLDHLNERLFSTDLEGFDALAELALDMRSSWNHATDQIWRHLDPVLWQLTRNPWVVLQTISRDKLQQDLADPAFGFERGGHIWIGHDDEVRAAVVELLLP
ncbi:MAG: DUF3417 domain-containing protein, partial [Variovorax sp.]